VGIHIGNWFIAWAPVVKEIDIIEDQVLRVKKWQGGLAPLVTRYLFSETGEIVAKVRNH